MVATVSSLHGGNATYYTKSYYLSGQAEGEWLETEAASAFRLAGKPVSPRAFERLLRGFHPTRDEDLVQNAGNPKRQLGWDVQFAVDKSFSVLYAMVPEARRELEACLIEAVRSTVLDVLEPEFLETRRGQGGRQREGVSSPVAAFLHRTNRENEIHLHCHAAIPNVGVREDGTSGTIVSWNLYDAKMALGKAFHARYAELVTNRLGIECEFDQHGLSRVRGFPEVVSVALSSPSRRIAELAEDESAKSKEEANLRVRPTKAEAPLEVVERECRRRAAELGFTEDEARDFLGKAPGMTREGEVEAAMALIREVVQSLPEDFSKAEFFEHAFRDGARAGIPFSPLRGAIRETLADEAIVEPLGRIGGKEQFRRIPELDNSSSPPGREETLEEFRRVLGDIIEATPGLDVAEFLPPISGWRAEQARSTLDRGVGYDRNFEDGTHRLNDADFDLGAIEAPIGPLGSALHRPGEEDAELFEAAGRRVQQDSVCEDLSPSLPPPVETEADDSRSLLGRVLEQVRITHAERILDSVTEAALGDITARDAHFTHDDFEAAVDYSLSGKSLPPGTKDAALERTLSDSTRVMPLGSVGGERRYTTPELFRAEEEGIRAAGILQGRNGHAEEPREISRRLGKLPLPERDAVSKALSGSDLMFIECPDGLRMQAFQRGLADALRKGILENAVDRALGRKDVLWVAPTATAARELERSVGAEHVATLQKFDFNLDRGLGETMRHHGQMLVNAALNRPTWEPRQLPITGETTVILDSASLAETRQFSRLLRHASEVGARVIACSTHDMPGLGPGGLFKELSGRSEEGNRVALAADKERDIRVVNTGGDRQAAKTSLIEQWAKEAMQAPQDHAIVAASSRDVRELNQMAQAERKKAGMLGFRSMEVRYRLNDELVKERIYEGDRIVFTARTDRDVVNGVFGTVKHIDLITGRMKVALDLKEKKYLPWEFDRQKTVEFQYRNYKFFSREEEGFRLGYASTVYRSQSVAVEGNSYCLLGGPNGATSAVYAGLGLAKDTNYFFGDQPERRAEALEVKTTAHAMKAQAEREEREREAGPVLQPDARRREAGQGMEMGI